MDNFPEGCLLLGNGRPCFRAIKNVNCSIHPLALTCLARFKSATCGPQNRCSAIELHRRIICHYSHQDALRLRQSMQKVDCIRYYRSRCYLPLIESYRRPCRLFHQKVGYTLMTATVLERYRGPRSRHRRCPTPAIAAVVPQAQSTTCYVG